MAQISWTVAGTTDSGDILNAIKATEPSLKYDNTDGSYILTTKNGNNVNVTIICNTDPGTLTTNALNTALSTIQTGNTSLKSTIVITAQSAVGVNLVDLTVAQQKALLVILLYKNGAISVNGTVNPLAQWV